MAKIVAQFADGRLLVHEDRLIGEIGVISGAGYITSGIPVRIGLLKKVESILALDNSYSQYGIITNPWDASLGGGVTSAVGYDAINVVMRRGDVGVGHDPALISGVVTSPVSGSAAAHPWQTVTVTSGCPTSGQAWMGELISGAKVSGVRIFATVVGY